MVATKVLDEALRGGESARLLEAQCQQQLKSAQNAVRDAVASAPQFLQDTRTRHDSLLNEATALETELEMLGESLDDITESSRQMLERAKEDARRKEALEDLAISIVPFVKIADALEQSDGIVDQGFDNLQKTLSTLKGAVAIAHDSKSPQLLRMVRELEEREDEATAMMKARYMDTFEVRQNCIVARGTSSRFASSPRGNVATTSAALERAGLLNEAIAGFASELIRNNVAQGIAKAHSFYEKRDDSGVILEWSVGADESPELLEFDMDDIEDLSDAEIDAMTDVLDISNAVARALKIFDLLRDNVVGEDYSRQLASALHSWFSEHVFPPDIVMSSVREMYGKDSVPHKAMRSRAIAASASAKVLQMALRARGATSFVFKLEMDSLESKVGSECRAQAILAARTAISSFSNARHDDSEMVSCPLSADRYIPRAQRPPEYFAPCLVTKSALIVHQVFQTARSDANDALQGGSAGIGKSMNAAALECLRSYRENVPLQHGEELRASLRLKALYYNDCMMFAHTCRMSAASQQSNTLIEEAEKLEEAANKAMMVVRRTAEQRLIENLNAACRNGALGAYGALTRIQRGSALSAAFSAMREVVSVFVDVVPTELAEVAGGRLIDMYISRLCNEVVALPEISAEGCEQITEILDEANKNVEYLLGLVKGMDVLRAGAPPPEIISKVRLGLQRMHAIREILNARMEDITISFRSGNYEGLISRAEVEHFIRGIFEDTPLRTSFIQDLDVTLKEEEGEWENNDW